MRATCGAIELFGKLLNKGLLDKQRPKKRKKKFSKTKKGVLYFSAAITCGFLMFLVFLRIETKLIDLKGPADEHKISWKVSIKPQNYALLKQKHRNTIDDQIQRHLLTGSRDELQRLSDNILSTTDFDKVIIKRTYKDHNFRTK